MTHKKNVDHEDDNDGEKYLIQCEVHDSLSQITMNQTSWDLNFFIPSNSRKLGNKNKSLTKKRALDF